jgi:hypothetical protein
MVVFSVLFGPEESYGYVSTVLWTPFAAHFSKNQWD